MNEFPLPWDRPGLLGHALGTAPLFSPTDHEVWSRRIPEPPKAVYNEKLQARVSEPMEFIESKRRKTIQLRAATCDSDKKLKVLDAWYKLLIKHAVDCIIVDQMNLADTEAAARLSLSSDRSSL